MNKLYKWLPEATPENIEIGKECFLESFFTHAPDEVIILYLDSKLKEYMDE